VVRVLGDTAGIEREEVANRLARDVNADGVDEDEAPDLIAAVL